MSNAGQAERSPGTIRRLAVLGAAAASMLALPIASEVRVTRATRPLTDRWQHLPVEPRRSTMLGISFRPL
ncbi:MAG: hypothetical protein JWL97_3823, partial [Gemmatimonadales bacterium]|nr:hypothetical protein [Gemmatimonadales bacterium]